MPNLSKLKAKMKAVKPFVIYSFKGVDDCLVEEGLALSVSANPPTMAFIIESNQITTLILRYSKSYQAQIEKLKRGDTTPEHKNKVAQQVLQEVADNMLSTEEEQAKQIAVLVNLGKEYLMAKAIDGWYGEEGEAEKFSVKFLDNKTEADVYNTNNEDSLAIYIETLTDMELLFVGMELIKALPSSEMPNIPMLEVVKNEETGQSEEVVTSSVPAEKVATFRRDLRNIAVEDVRPESRENTQDSDSVPTV